MAVDLASACARISKVPNEQIEQWRASGRKENFFARMQEATLPFNLTGVAHNEPRSHHLLQPPAQSDAPRPTPRILIVGDSIAREMAAALRTLVSTHARVSYFQVNSPTNLAAPPVERVNSSAWQVGAIHAIGPSAMHELQSCNYDVFVLGGYGPWSIRRMERHKIQPDSDLAISPILAHEAFIARELQVMRCIARETETDLVFLGSLPLDARTLLLHPPKAKRAPMRHSKLREALS